MDLGQRVRTTDTTFDVDMPSYALPGYELVRQVFIHVPAADLPARFPADVRWQLRGHSAVVAARREVMALLSDLATKKHLWRVYHVYTEFGGDHNNPGIVTQVTVVGEVYKVPGTDRED